MNNNYLTLTITKDLANQKIREILTEQFKLSQKGITRLKQSPHGILINGHRVTVRHKVQTNDVLAILVNVPETPSTIVPRMMKLTIVYEDEAVLALDKPAHLPLYPRFQNDDQNLASGVLAYFAHQQGPKVFRPVGRLDKNTSGLVLIAKTADVQHWLSLQQLEKTYLALAGGMITHEGKIEAPIGRYTSTDKRRVVMPEGKYACTFYQPVAEICDNTLLKLSLATGRTHQIRVHCQFIGHPLLGDDLYGGDCTLWHRQALHLEKLSFIQPLTKEKISLQQPFTELIEKYHLTQSSEPVVYKDKPSSL